ncbi:MAG: hypothetical protein ACUVTY_15075 [Armatimonadota bacterium]
MRKEVSNDGTTALHRAPPCPCTDWSHRSAPHLRRILAEDIQLLYTGTASFLRAPSDIERDALVRLINLPQGLDTEERVKAYLQVASRLDKPYL